MNLCFMGRKKYFLNDCFVIMSSSYPRRIAYCIYHGSQSKQSNIHLLTELSKDVIILSPKITKNDWLTVELENRLITVHARLTLCFSRFWIVPFVTSSKYTSDIKLYFLLNKAFESITGSITNFHVIR